MIDHSYNLSLSLLNNLYTNLRTLGVWPGLRSTCDRARGRPSARSRNGGTWQELRRDNRSRLGVSARSGTGAWMRAASEAS